MFQTGRVATMISQDLGYKLEGYYKCLQMRYIPQELAHEEAVQRAEATVAELFSSSAGDNGHSYEEARSSVRERHRARFAARTAPCK